MTALVVLFVLAVVVVIAVSLGVRTVPQGQVWTVERFGAFTRVLQPGLNLLVPFVELVGHKMNVQEIVLDIPEQAVITRDNAAVVVDGIMYYRVLDPVRAAYGAQNLVQALTTVSMTNIRSVIGSMDLDAALSGREEINARLLTTLDHATEPWGVKVGRVELRKIEPPANLVMAMNLQMTAERERRATVARAMGEREAAVARAEGQKQATVLQAEARLEAAMKDAAARERLAEAEARATQSVAAAAGGAGGEEALRYFIAQKYVEAIRALGREPQRADTGDPGGDGGAGRGHRAGAGGDADGPRRGPRNERAMTLLGRVVDRGRAGRGRAGDAGARGVPAVDRDGRAGGGGGDGGAGAWGGGAWDGTGRWGCSWRRRWGWWVWRRGGCGGGYPMG